MNMINRGHIDSDKLEEIMESANGWVVEFLEEPIIRPVTRDDLLDVSQDQLKMIGEMFDVSESQLKLAAIRFNLPHRSMN